MIIAAGILAALCVALHFYLLKANYAHNSGLETAEQDFINDQNGERCARYRFGLRSAKPVGCEAIALHNARLLLGRPSRLSDVIRDVERSCAPILFGLLGTNPLALGRVLRREGIPFEKVGLRELNREGVYVLSFWNGKRLTEGLHTVCYTNTRRGSFTFNLYGNGRIMRQEPEDYAARFICGYYLGPGKREFFSPDEKNRPASPKSTLQIT